MTKKLRIGIKSYQQMKADSIAVARGERTPDPDEPKVWFTSMESLAHVLSRHNKQLLALINEAKPNSITELGRLSGRAKSNLSRTLKTMEKYGLVSLQLDNGRIKPRLLFTEYQLEDSLVK